MAPYGGEGAPIISCWAMTGPKKRNNDRVQAAAATEQRHVADIMCNVGGLWDAVQHTKWGYGAQ